VSFDSHSFPPAIRDLNAAHMCRYVRVDWRLMVRRAPPSSGDWSSPCEPDTPTMGDESPRGESSWRIKRSRRRGRGGSSVTSSNATRSRPFIVPASRLLRLSERCGVYDSTLGSWVKQDEIDCGVRDGVSTSDREEVAELRRENARLRTGA
jgi:hypothetical protein